jgi:hypothetical protein
LRQRKQDFPRTSRCAAFSASSDDIPWVTAWSTAAIMLQKTQLQSSAPEPDHALRASGTPGRDESSARLTYSYRHGVQRRSIRRSIEQRGYYCVERSLYVRNSSNGAGQRRGPGFHRGVVGRNRRRFPLKGRSEQVFDIASAAKAALQSRRLRRD